MATWLYTLLQKTFLAAGGLAFSGADGKLAPSCRF
jgi:hypothetical protein